MARVLVIHHDKTIRTILEAMTRSRYELEGAKHVEAGVKQLRRKRPDVVVVGQDAKKQEAARLLRYLNDNGLKIPVVVVVSRGGGVFQKAIMKLGAKGFIEYPVEQSTYESAIEEALTPATEKPKASVGAEPPPITRFELASNLSRLETALNKKMKCVAGKNQVYIRSLIAGRSKSKPRICLKCPLRAEYGLNREVFFEFIRDICCNAPGKCEAVQKFNATRMTG